MGDPRVSPDMQMMAQGQQILRDAAKATSNQVSNAADQQSTVPQSGVDSAKTQGGTGGGQMDPNKDPKPKVQKDKNGQLRDEKGQFASDPDNPSDPSKYTTTDRRNDWKAEAQNPTREYSAEDMARMARGEPPQRFNPNTGKVESMERSHEPIPRRNGGTATVPRWPDEHAKVDPDRKLPKGYLPPPQTQPQPPPQQP